MLLIHSGGCLPIGEPSKSIPSQRILLIESVHISQDNSSKCGH